MELKHKPLIYLFYNILDKDIQKCIIDFISIEVESKNRYDTKTLWIIDQKIGGVGAYAMPPNPVVNPYPSGIERSLYRPLQYARSDIDICDVKIHARYVVLNSGMHLETVCRLILRYYNILGDLRFHNTTFGRAVQKIKTTNNVDSNIISALENFVVIYNLSKHEVNQDEERERLFNAFEAITAYFSARILGVTLLRQIKFLGSNIIYETNND